MLPFKAICFSLILSCTISGCNQTSDKPSKDSINSSVHSEVIIDTLSTKKKQQSLKDSIHVVLTNDSLLPPIKSLKYVSTQTALERMYFKYIPNFEDSLTKFLKYYNRRLSDFGKYNTYFIYINCSQDSTSKCICYDNLFYGLLMLYDPITKEANIINASYDFATTSQYEMSFSIESNNTIILREMATSEGEGGEPEDYDNGKHIIKISKEGLIQTSIVE